MNAENSGTTMDSSTGLQRLEVADTEVIFTSEGKPTALLIGVTEETLGAMLRAVRRARAQVAISRMRQSAEQAGLAEMNTDVIEAEIAVVRRERTSQ